jgi:hypothetical protein
VKVLLIDKDGFETGDDENRDRICRVAGDLGLKLKRVDAYITRHGYHYVVETEQDFSDVMAIVYQLFMGSDWKRELINLERSHREKGWNVLFSSKFVGRKFSGREVKLE